MKSRRQRKLERQSRKRRIRLTDVIGYGSLLGFLLVVAYLAAPMFQFGLDQGSPSVNSGVTRAVVIDQLSSIKPDSKLIPTTIRMLSAHGIAYDVALPSDVTVAFYARLAANGYRLIILRVHTGIGDPNSDVPIGLFTNEPYDPNRYVVEQGLGLVGAARANEASPPVFAVTPKFIRETMRGKFDNAIVILGGCYGLRGSDLAQAFVDKGARVVVGWTGLVDLSHTDSALNVFLQEFLGNGKNIQEAVEATMRSVGPDPYYKSELSYYPTNQGGISLSTWHVNAPILAPATRPTATKPS